MAKIGENMKRRARQADLYTYLLEKHPETVKKIGYNVLQNRDFDSLKITKGHGYNRFSNDEHGNAIDYLMKYLDFDFVSAVKELIDYAPDIDELPYDSDCYVPVKKYTRIYLEPYEDSKLPPPVDGPYSRAFAYLTKTRALPANIITDLMHKELLYEDEKHNAVFTFMGYAEIVGTCSEVRYKQCIGQGYWVLNSNDDNTKLYICESAIDAISLYCLLGDDNATYVSVSGVTKYSAIVSAMEDFAIYQWFKSEVFLAFDNDKAGDDAYDTLKTDYPKLLRIKPKLKDWNDDLKAKIHM